MNAYLKAEVKALIAVCERTWIERTEEEAELARTIAREGRVLLLHDTTDTDAEAWLDSRASDSLRETWKGRP